MSRYRLLYGRHVMTHPDDQKVGDDGRMVAKTLADMPPAINRNWIPRELILTPGAVFETDEDLTRYNGRGMDGKYELISEAGMPIANDPFHWDRTKETLAQFTHRMEQMGANKSDPNPSQVNVPQGPPQEIETETSAPPVPAFVNQDYKTWDIAKLKEFAQQEEIEIKGLTTRDAILKKIATDQANLVGAGK